MPIFDSSNQFWHWNQHICTINFLGMIYLGWHPHVWWQYSILQSFMVLLACEFPCHQRSRYWCRHPARGEQVLREKGCLSATPGHRSTLKAVMSPNLEGIFSASYNSSEMVLVTFCHVWFRPVTVEGYCSWRKSGPMNVFWPRVIPHNVRLCFFSTLLVFEDVFLLERLLKGRESIV